MFEKTKETKGKRQVKVNLKTRNQILSLLHDKILQRSERKMKVVNQKDDKNKVIVLRSITFQLWLISGHLFLFSAVMYSIVQK